MRKFLYDGLAPVGFFIIVAGVLCLLLSSCGHNVITLSKGFGFETTMRPDSGNFGVVRRYGEILSVCVRENSKISMSSDSGVSGENKEVADKESITIDIGKQITGYTVDAIKAGADVEKLH